MNIEELKNNTEYADTYDGMYIEMTYAEKPEFRLLFDKCYFSNIFGEPDLSGKGWNGFTREWQQMERAFSIENQHPVLIDDIDEYLTDLYSYKSRMENYKNPDSLKVYLLICNFLEYAKINGFTVMVEEQ